MFKMLVIAAGVALGVLGVMFLRGLWPDIMRYQRIRSM